MAVFVSEVQEPTPRFGVPLRARIATAVTFWPPPLIISLVRPALRSMAVGSDSSRHVVIGALLVGNVHVDVDVRIDPVDLAHDARDRRALRRVELAGNGVVRGRARRREARARRNGQYGEDGSCHRSHPHPE